MTMPLILINQCNNFLKPWLLPWINLTFSRMKLTVDVSPSFFFPLSTTTASQLESLKEKKRNDTAQSWHNEWQRMIHLLCWVPWIPGQTFRSLGPWSPTRLCFPWRKGRRTFSLSIETHLSTTMKMNNKLVSCLFVVIRLFARYQRHAYLRLNVIEG